MSVPTVLVDIVTPADDITCEALSVSVHHGRDDATTQPEASTAVIELIGPLPDGARIGNPLRVRGVLGASFDRFVGRITDLQVAWDDVDHARPRIIAAGDLARLGRSEIGATPWAEELDGARVTRILTAAGLPPDPLLTDPGRVRVLARDVDRQPALELAHGVASDGGGVLWEDRSGRVLYADAEHRRGVVAALEVQACDIGAGAGWTTGLEGLVNDVFVRYGAATPQAEYHASSAPSIAERGTYGASLSTRIATAGDAQQRADGIIARQADPGWIFGGLELELGLLDDATTAALLELEVHDLIRVTGLPAGSPATTVDLWVEGWRETVTPDGWRIAYATSDYCRTAAYGRWDDLAPAQTWDSIGAATRWDDVSCLPPLPSAGRWDDAAGSLRWDNVAPATTWDSWTG